MRAFPWALIYAGVGWGSGCGWQRSGAWGGGAAGAEPDRGESQSNGTGDELRRGAPAGTREEVERVGELVVRLLAGEAE